ncbi:MAG: hypothetical protein ACKVOE_09525 [Rickettsiales bacterium]
MVMELDPQEVSRVWWKGAFSSALKGIPQGLFLGLLAATAMYGLIAGMLLVGGPIGAVGLSVAQGMGGFIYTGAASQALAGATAGSALGIVTSFSSFSVAAMVALNGVLSAVGNFMSGGKIAVNAYKQEFDHKQNEARLDRIESREIALEECVTPSRHVQKILAAGPRQRDSFASAEEGRAAEPTAPTIH